MYRQYENARALESDLKALKTEYTDAQKSGADFDTLLSLHEKIEDMTARVNFAWQDDEYNAGFTD